MTTRIRFLVCLAICAASAPAVPRSQERGVRPVEGSVPNHYIVVLRETDDPVSVGLETQAAHRGQLTHIYEHSIHGFAIVLTREAAAAVAADARVNYVEEDGVVRINDVQASAPWGLDRIDQRALPLDGQYNYPAGAARVYVHVIDTGIRDTHVEFGGRAFIQSDSVDDDGDNDPNDVGNDDGNPSVPDGADCNGHGTHVAGTVGGETYGVAKSVTLLAHRALDCSGSGRVSAIIAAIDRVTADARRPAVANMSLGGSASTALDDAVRRSIAAGVVYAVSAGNDNRDASVYSPARVTEAITVAATASNDARASFSNFGSSVDLFAPGVSIRSTWFSSNTATAILSGTSMASPHVAGAAALYLQQQGDRSPAQVRDALVAAATTGVVTDPAGSANRLLYTAFLLVAPPPPPPPPPAGTNVALASNGSVASPSSLHGTGWPASAAINGDRRGLNAGSGGVWADGTREFPDWLQVDFARSYSLTQINVFTIQDAVSAPAEPTPSMTFTSFGITAFEAQYWTGTAWATVPGGSVTGNNNVWRTFTFPAVTTTRIRILVNGAATAYSYIAEVEAYGSPAEPPPPAPVNVALASSGSVASASSLHGAGWPASAAINGDRRGLNAGSGGVWADGTREFPDWLQVDFAGSYSLTQINVFTIQDAVSAPAEPTSTMTFTSFGITAFEVQYWTGTAWVTVPGGSVTGNNNVWRAFTFPAITTSRIRILVNGSATAYSYITEIEAFGVS